KGLALELARALGLPSAQHEPFVRFARNPAVTAPEGAFGETPAAAPAAVSAPPSAQAAAAPTIHFQPPAPLTAALGRERDANVVISVLRLPGARLVTL